VPAKQRSLAVSTTAERPDKLPRLAILLRIAEARLLRSASV